MHGRCSRFLIWPLAAAALAGCGGQRFSGYWLNRPVIIDGKAGEWGGALYSLEESRILVGALNDSTTLCFCIGTEDQMLKRRLVTQGLTLWLDPGGGKKKVFGIHFPLGRHPGGPPGAGDPSGGRLGAGDPPGAERRNGPGGAERPDSANASAPPGSPASRSGSDFRTMDLIGVSFPPDSVAQLEILQGSNPPVRMTVSQARGLALKLGLDDEALVYELRIPLIHDEAHPYSIDAVPGGRIGIGLEAPEWKRPGGESRENTWDRPGGGSDRGGSGGQGRFPSDGGDNGGDNGGDGSSGPDRGGRGGNGDWGSRGGGWGGGPGGMSGGRGPGRWTTPSGPLEVWVTVELARSNQPVQP